MISVKELIWYFKLKIIKMTQNQSQKIQYRKYNWKIWRHIVIKTVYYQKNALLACRKCCLKCLTEEKNLMSRD